MLSSIAGNTKLIATYDGKDTEQRIDCYDAPKAVETANTEESIDSVHGKESKDTFHCLVVEPPEPACVIVFRPAVFAETARRVFRRTTVFGICVFARFDIGHLKMVVIPQGGLGLSLCLCLWFSTNRRRKMMQLGDTEKKIGFRKSSLVLVDASTKNVILGGAYGFWYDLLYEQKLDRMESRIACKGCSSACTIIHTARVSQIFTYCTLSD